MAKLRRLNLSKLVNVALTSFGPSDVELDRVRLCLTVLTENPSRGQPIMFAGYEGGHRIIVCGRFYFVYQFSDREVRVKDVGLWSNCA